MTRALFSGILTVLFTAGMIAQAKPDFSGTWTLDPDRSVMGGGGRPGGGGQRGMGMGGGPITITIDGAKMSVARTMGQSGNTVTTVYMLDGADASNTMGGRGGADPVQVVYKSKWDGAKLVTTITNPMRTSTETRWLEADGTMVVETTGPGRDGTPVMTKLVYKKS